MSDSQQPHGLQPTSLLHPWDFPGKSTGVGCHCLLRNVTEVMVNVTEVTVAVALVMVTTGVIWDVMLWVTWGC